MLLSQWHHYILLQRTASSDTNDTPRCAELFASGVWRTPICTAAQSRLSVTNNLHSSLGSTDAHTRTHTHWCSGSSVAWRETAASAEDHYVAQRHSRTDKLIGFVALSDWLQSDHLKKKRSLTAHITHNKANRMADMNPAELQPPSGSIIGHNEKINSVHANVGSAGLCIIPISSCLTILTNCKLRKM